MPGEKGFLSLLVVVLVAGTAYYLPSSAGSAARSTASAVVAPVATSVSGGASDNRSPRREDAISLLAEHFGKADLVDETTENPDVVGRLKALRLPGNIAVEFLIATVPDPIDSNARWQFDPIYDSIQRAVSAKGYSFDRFYIPDWDPSRNPDADQRRVGGLHERLPGVVLFRRNDNAFLVVLLAFETATGGVHPIALRRALLTVAQWSAECRKSDRAVEMPCTGPVATDDIRILGPTFSGSIPSIGAAIDAVIADGTTPHFTIVSGAATSDINRQLLETPERNGTVRYSATVLSDKELLNALSGFLAEHVDRGRMAVLVESNTAYGESLRTSLLSQNDNTLCRNGCTVLPFPLHISRLRNAVDNGASVANSPATLRRGVPLSLDEPSNPEDQMPSMAPRLTSSSTDVAISQILNTIEREDIAVIGLFATDARDKLFLAQQIMLQSPNALLFTMDGDLLFTHPDFVRYTRGMIVASSYPLFTGTQLWKPTATGTAIRQQFVSASAQGVYNAGLALLAYGLDGHPLTTELVPLVDYRSAGSAQPSDSGPYAWMSAVGRNGMLPIDRQVVRCAGCWTFKNSLPPTPKDDDRPIHASASMIVVFIGFQAFIAWYFWKQSARLLASGMAHHPWTVGRTWDALCEMALVIAQYGTLIVLEAHNVVMKEYSSGSEAWVAWSFGLVAKYSAVVLWGALAVLGLVRHGSGIGRLLWSVPPRPRLRRIAASAGLIVPFGVVVAAIVALPNVTAGLMGAQPLPTLNRGLQLFSGLSPFDPVMVIVVAVYGWSSVQRIRVTTPTLLRIDRNELDRLAVGGFVRLSHKVANVVESVDAWFVFAALAVASIIGYVLLAFIADVQTIENARFDAFFLFGWVLLQALVVASLTSHFRLWRATQELLKSLSVHPIVGAFDRVPRELFAKRLPAARPRLIHITHAVNAHASMVARRNSAESSVPRADPGSLAIATAVNDHARAIRTLTPSLALGPAASRPPFKTGEELRKVLAEILSVLPGDPPPASATVSQVSPLEPPPAPPQPELSAKLEGELRRNGRKDIADSDTWKAVIGEAASIVPQLRFQPVAGSGAGWEADGETFVAVTIALMVRELSARVVRSIHVIFGALLALVVYEMSLRAYPRGLMLGLTWMYVAAGVMATLFTLVSAERDVVLSRLAGTTPGKIQWDAVFVTRTLIPVLFAVFTLLAMQFPAVGNLLLGWLKPMQTAIP